MKGQKENIKEATKKTKNEENACWKNEKMFKENSSCEK